MKELVIAVIDEDRDTIIRRFETEMFAKYKKAVEPFAPLFGEMGCSVKLEQWWVNKNHNTWCTSRLPMEIGYECRICCIVERNGEEVHIVSHDGETDYYALVTSWTISSYIRRGFNKLKVYLYASIDDVDSELNNFLSQLKNIE